MSEIRLTLVGADDAFAGLYKIEIQRAADRLGLPDESRVELRPNALRGTAGVYLDDDVAPGIAYWYRFRHVGCGDDPSEWTEWTRAEAE